MKIYVILGSIEWEFEERFFGFALDKAAADEMAANLKADWSSLEVDVEEVEAGELRDLI